MAVETLLRPLQERMSKLTRASATLAARIEELRSTIENTTIAVTNAAELEEAAADERKRLSSEIEALRDHIGELTRNKQDPALIAALNDELRDLEASQPEVAREAERLASTLRDLQQSLENLRAELESAELAHRQVTEQAMKLREHLESLMHERRTRH
jgi:chromosome segregation ATPase